MPSWKSVSIRIAPRLGLAALLFLVPIVYLVWLVTSEQKVAIAFAAKEVDGAAFLRGLLSVEAAADKAVLDGTAPPAASMVDLRDRLAGSINRLGVSDDTGAATDVMRGTDVAAARKWLRDLISLVGDHSNLILDNVLDSYYLTDVVLNRVPDLLDRVTDLSVAASQPHTDAVAAAHFLESVGGLSEVLDGLAASMTSAISDNADGSLKAALADRAAALHDHVTAYAQALQTPGTSVDVHPILAEAAAFADAATGELERILAARVSGFKSARLVSLSVSLLLFIAAVGAGAFLLAVALLHTAGASRDDIIAEVEYEHALDVMRKRWQADHPDAS